MINLEKTEIKMLMNVGQYKKDKVISINTNPVGIPVDRFWRRRIQDAKKDNCIQKLDSHNSKPVKNYTKKKVKNDND